MEQETKNLSSIILETLRLKGLTVEKLSQISGVSERFLSSLIEGNIEKLPPRPYAHGYLIRIAEALNLDGEKLWSEYLKNNEAIRRSGKNDQLPKNRFAIPALNKKIIALILAAIILISYALIRLPTLLGNPKLTIQNLTEERTIAKSSPFTIKGKINPKDQLAINGEIVYSKDGDFEKIQELQPGFNTITFKVKKFLGKERTVTKQIFYEPPETPKKEEAPVENPTSIENQSTTTNP